jgi:ABC-type transport system involved in multi-copper enzyme maturation permease subunit
MTLLPVISRELRAAARHGFTYYLRTIGAGTALLVCVLYGMGHVGQNQGAGLFASLHLTLFFAIGIFVPILTADCISRERREGTLGLLFLTGLSASTIVVAKGFANGLRALTFWLAVMPVVALPLLLGGITWGHALQCGLVDFSALCWALAAGMLASSATKVRHRALIVAISLSVLFLTLLAFGAGWMLWGSTPWAVVRNQWGISDYILCVAIQLGLFSDQTFAWSPALLTAVSTARLLVVMAKVSGLSVLGLVFAIVIAGTRTRRVWQEEPPSKRQVWFYQTFCSPIILDKLYHRWLRWMLERNPIGWLEHRVWTGRLVTWGWLAVVVALYSALFSDRNFIRGYSGLQRSIAWLIAGSMAITAAGSFRRERESGVMELLLVSPISEERLVWGRLTGLWGQFLPAIVLLFGVWFYFSSFLPDSSGGGAFWLFACTFLTVPVIGLYYSLSCRSYITALLATLTIGILLPIVSSEVLMRLFWPFMGNPGVYYDPMPDFTERAILIQTTLAVWSRHQLLKRLKCRSFPLERAEK